MTSTKEIQSLIQDCNVNFLMGSGLSVPYFSALGNIETLLTELGSSGCDVDTHNLIRGSICKSYCDAAMLRNVDLLEDHADATDVLERYKKFLSKLNTIMLERKSSILGRQVNLFTTNMDIFHEKAFESTGVEFNDGFHGRFRPRFDATNFRKSTMKKSLQYDNVSEIPVFNLFKLHGSVSWEKRAADESIHLSWSLDQLRRLKDMKLEPGSMITVENTDDIAALIKKASSFSSPSSDLNLYLEEYDRLLIVNPNKEKFKDTLLNQTYYDLLRVFSNELEKENTVLFVLGFSFADEHIRHITLRAANANPTLKIIVFAYSSSSGVGIRTNFGSTGFVNQNIEILTPDQTVKNGSPVDDFNFDFETVTDRFFNLPEFIDRAMDVSEVPPSES